MSGKLPIGATSWGLTMNIQNLSHAVQALLDQNQHVAFDFEASHGDFVVTGFEAREAVNEPFEIQIELASHDADIDLHVLMDAEARLGIYDRHQQPRFLHGVITDISRGVGGNHRTFYEVTLRPSLWRLTQTSDSRIWQQKSVPDIAKQILSEHKVSDVEWRLAESYQPREFLTQREERHIAFITRILAEEGIFYYFEHKADGHKLIFTDAPLSTPTLENAPELTYNAIIGGTNLEPHIRAFRLHERLRSSNYELNDFTFKNPNARMKENQGAQDTNGLTQDYALYDYPGRYKDPSNVGKNFVKSRIEAERVDATTGSGETNSVQLSPGFHFTITDHDYAQANGSHFILSVTHKGTQTAALEEETPDAQPTTYSASFTTMPTRLPYRPAVPAKPVVDGPQIAIVTGPAGEEIYTDEHGRVKCWFPWDRHNGKNENSSCWIRVTHASSGMNYGHATIPRIGSEVLVQYLDGDIDQPIITGMAYNPTKKHAYDLPAHKTRSYWKDQTHKGDGFNEIRFESENGREEIFVHAERDRNEKIKNNHTERIDNNFVQSVGQNYVSQVDRNRDEYVNGSFHLTIGASGSARPVNPRDMEEREGLGHLGNNQRVSEKSGLPDGDYGLNIHQNRSEQIGGSDQTTVSKTKDISVGGRFSIKSQADITIDAGKGLSIDSDKSLSINSAQTIQMSCGDSSIILQKDGTVMIKGKRILIDADELADIETGTQIVMKSGKISLN